MSKRLASSLLFCILLNMASCQEPVYEEMKVELELEEDGGLPEAIEVTVPVDKGKFLTLDLIRKEDNMKDVVVILGSDGEDQKWEPHKDEKFHVYSDLHYHATFSVAINQTAKSDKLSMYGSFHHNGRFYSMRPDDNDFDRHALELESLQEFFVKYKGHQHIVTEDKPVERNDLNANDFIRPDEL